MAQDIHKEAALKKMKFYATSLFILMVIIFLLAKFGERTYAWAWLGFIRAFAEAAMIGALADWFAVTALFAHPLGIPLPHTNIIQKNQERIGYNLGNFIDDNFLKPKMLEEKLRNKDIVENAARWLADKKNSDKATNELCFIIKEIIKGSDDDDIRRFIRQNATSAIRSIKLAPTVGKILTILTSKNEHQLLFDRIIIHLKNFLYKYRIDSSGGLFGWFQLIFKQLKLSFIIGELDNISRDKNHEIRRAFNQLWKEFIERLNTSDQFRKRIEQFKEDFLQDTEFQKYLDDRWKDIKNEISRDLDATDSNIKRNIYEALNTISQGLLRDSKARQKINERILDAAIIFISKYHEEISHYIAENVKKWEPPKIRRKLELEIGKDLQFIRINGTIIGGIVGLLIHSVSLLIDSRIG